MSLSMLETSNKNKLSFSLDELETVEWGFIYCTYHATNTAQKIK